MDGKLYHPDGVWDPDTIYVTVYSKREFKFKFLFNKIIVFLVIIAVSSDIKRKGVGEQQDEMTISSIGQTKTQRLDYGHETNNILDEEENDPNRRCVDLIVLGISYRSLEADVKKCFSANCIMLQIIVKCPAFIINDYVFTILTIFWSVAHHVQSILKIMYFILL